MKNCLSYLKHYKKEMIIGPSFKLLEAILELLVPLMMAKVIDEGIPNGDQAYILKIGGLIILFGFLGLGCSMICQYFASKAGNGYGKELRKGLFEHLHSLSFQEIDRIGSGNLVNIMTNDVNQLQNAVNMFIRLLIRSPFLIVGSVVCAFLINWKMGCIFLAVIPIISLILWFFMKKASKKYLAIQKKLDELSSLTEENVSGSRVVRAFHKEEESEQRFEQETKHYQKNAMSIAKWTSLLNPLTYAVINVAILAILYFGAFEVRTENLSQGDIVALVNYMNQILLALIVVSNLVSILTKATASYKRCNEFMSITSSMKNGAEKAFSSPNALYEFKNVSFYYPNSENPVIENLSFKIHRGEIVGLIGGTGSGKSTILALIEHFYDATKGEVLVGESAIQNIDTRDLRTRVALVDQKATLFKGTIRSQFLMVKHDASDEEIWEALRFAEADSFVKDFDDGLDHIVEENGKNLSGGQKQRISIARAWIRHPELLILDDSTSALDYLTDAKIRHKLHALLSEMSILMVSQRTTSLQNADRILVMDNGRLVGEGTHSELLNTCSVYREINESQVKEEGERA